MLWHEAYRYKTRLGCVLRIGGVGTTTNAKGRAEHGSAEHSGKDEDGYTQLRKNIPSGWYVLLK